MVKPGVNSCDDLINLHRVSTLDTKLLQLWQQNLQLVLILSKSDYANVWENFVRRVIP